jgi:beta-glucosidase
LSYTRFEYANVRATVAEASGEVTVSVSVEVTNTGARAGDEVVQVYLRDEVASVTTPERALKAFRRIHLDANQKQTVEFKLGAADLAVLDRSMKWVVEPGTFEVMVGASCLDIRQRGKFEVKKGISLRD